MVAASTRSQSTLTPMPGPVGTGTVPSPLTSIPGLIRSGSEIAGAGGDVARHREVREGREGDVVGTADAAFQHAAAPDGNPVGLAEVVEADGRSVAADPPRLDVDDPAVLEGDRSSAARTVWIDSSRQIGVAIRFCRAA